MFEPLLRPDHIRNWLGETQHVKFLVTRKLIVSRRRLFGNIGKSNMKRRGSLLQPSVATHTFISGSPTICKFLILKLQTGQD
ncbi:hypothetical protein MPTK1_4g00130 [Marchantia polymorpha subsp. ruderalis]|uniref:Uncharacterized protein n=2 Tax=Marchantia polymorpha TaxID=3197 RepID=A0AAF6B4R8_MARPO|nr:hypothetical protein MARPO_0162s0008 [Marchantia polymorpha]BBN07002.1 hypothetical protein Mp_4g00130 [Marchantia polymorpha subsp. ruderalis]|eukprot:PTQ28475.1 hypothetical protein MARPO_0162s0008 [Marchantia polymorpha]